MKNNLKIIIPAIAIITAIILTISFYYLKNDEPQTEENSAVLAKEVETILVSEADGEGEIKISGAVAPISEVSVVALGGGTIQSLYFEVGDSVTVNKLLASIYKPSVLSNYETSLNSFNNSANNIKLVRQSGEQSIKQAEAAVLQAENSVRSAQIAIENSEGNLKNIVEIQEKNEIDLQLSAISSFSDFLNTAENALVEADYIVKAKGDSQLVGIEKTLSVKDPQALINARYSILSAWEEMNKLKKLELNQKNIKENLGREIIFLDSVKVVLDNILKVLDKTVTSIDFSEAALNGQISKFSGIRSSAVNTIQAAQRTYQGLENIKLSAANEKQNLENNLVALKNQLDTAQLNYNNAKLALEAAVISLDQQLLSAKSSLDNLEGQLKINREQLSNLTIKAPISGKVVARYAEVGTEVNQGQKIADISKIDLVKIVFSLPSEDVYKINVGREVLINNEIKASIYKIEPAADSVTKKVGVEILYDNKDKNLIAGTFVDVVIPIETLKRGEAGSFFIPLKSLIITQNEKFVFLNKNGIAKKTLVVSGEALGSVIEIFNGLEAGDELIIEGAKNLEDGEQITIKNKNIID